MKIINSLFITFIITISWAGEPVGYYNSAQGLEGFALRQALHSIIKNHHIIPYTSTAIDTTDAIKVLDQDPINTNKVILIYSGYSDWKTNFGTTGWEREHIWPNSYGIDSVQPAYSDLFNLRAIDSTVNSSRGNKYYDISDTNAPSYNFPAHIEAPECSTDSNSWEPRPYDRGWVARVICYMDVRYEGDHVSEPDLVLTENTNIISSTTNRMGRYSTILLWNSLYPVSVAESNRNDAIYSLYQTNRNPFVDHPEWVDLAFKPKLHIELVSNAVLLWWKSEWTNATLLSSTNVLGNWNGYGTTPTNTGTQFQLTVNITNNYRFFRLNNESYP